MRSRASAVSMPDSAGMARARLHAYLPAVRPLKREVGADGALAFLMTLSGMFSRLQRRHEVHSVIRSRRGTSVERTAGGLAVLAGFAILILATPLAAQNRFILESSGAAEAQVATAPHGMVVSQEKRATEIGLDVLARGGNAVDAAVAVGFALAVTLPKAGNIGGGGFMVVHLADRHEDVAIDYREAAPGAARSDIFLGPGKARRTPTSPATPGSASACRAPSPGFRSRSRSTAPASSPSPT